MFEELSKAAFLIALDKVERQWCNLQGRIRHNINIVGCEQFRCPLEVVGFDLFKKDLIWTEVAERLGFTKL